MRTLKQTMTGDIDDRRDADQNHVPEVFAEQIDLPQPGEGSRALRLQWIACSAWSCRDSPWGCIPRKVSLSLGRPKVRVLLTGNTRCEPRGLWGIADKPIRCVDPSTHRACECVIRRRTTRLLVYGNWEPNAEFSVSIAGKGQGVRREKGRVSWVSFDRRSRWCAVSSFSPS